MRQVPFASLIRFQGYFSYTVDKKRDAFLLHKPQLEKCIHYNVSSLSLHIDIKLWMTIFFVENFTSKCSFFAHSQYTCAEIKKEGNIWLSSIEIIYFSLYHCVHDLNKNVFLSDNPSQNIIF